MAAPLTTHVVHIERTEQSAELGIGCDCVITITELHTIIFNFVALLLISDDDAKKI